MGIYIGNASVLGNSMPNFDTDQALFDHKGTNNLGMFYQTGKLTFIIEENGQRKFKL